MAGAAGAGAAGVAAGAAPGAGAGGFGLLNQLDIADGLDGLGCVPLAVSPSLTATSLTKKYVMKAIINGSNTNIQEIVLNPFEHSQFNTHAQITRKSASVRSVQTP